jgi:hypothetical protein
MWRSKRDLCFMVLSYARRLCCNKRWEKKLFVLLLLGFTRRKSGICRRLFGLRSPPFVDDAKIPGCIVDGFVVE